MKNVIIALLLILPLFSKECADQFDPNNFIDAPTTFDDFVKENSKDINIFNDKPYKKVSIDGVSYYIRKKAVKKVGDYIYPVKGGLWRYRVDKSGKIDEYDIAKIFNYKDDLESIASEINSDFEGLWSSWKGDAYGVKLIPEDLQLRYKDSYFALTVFIYGVKDDATTLKESVVNYHFIDYTNEVKKYIKCKESK